MRLPILLCLAVALLAAGCTRPTSESAAPEQTERHAEAEIAWYDGDVESAFAAAKSAGKPLFLYWGAEWCPPCHYLKDKIFKRPEFVAASRRFIAVYLDGDTERAQHWGERFATAGYPTVIVFDPEGTEVLRMSSGIPIAEYTGVLDVALGRMRPVKDVLADVLADGPAAASADDLRLLASHSWFQDQTLTDEERLTAFRRLYEETPADRTVERSRFLALFLQEAEHQAAKAEAGEEAEEDEEDEALFTADEAAALAADIGALLADRELRNANVFFVSYGLGAVPLLYPEPTAEREALLAAWEEAARLVEGDETLSVADRLGALQARIAAARLRLDPAADDDAEPPLPPELADHVRERVAAASAQVTDEGELQAVLNTMAGLLANAGLADEAEALLSERMDDALAPHYYMSWMGQLKQDAGEPQEALAWHRKAYDAARGPYTRFQWGSGYVRNLIELAPDDAAAVEAASLEVLGELLELDDAFANRNRSRLERLEAAYRGWNENGGHAASVERIRDFVRAACERFPGAGEEGSQHERCRSFLAEDEAA